MPLPLVGDRSDNMNGNGKRLKALAGLAAAIAAAFVAADAAKNQREADKHLAEAARLQKKSDDLLSAGTPESRSGKGKGSKDLWQMYGDNRGGFGENDLLSAPNASTNSKAGF